MPVTWCPKSAGLCCRYTLGGVGHELLVSRSIRSWRSRESSGAFEGRLHWTKLGRGVVTSPSASMQLSDGPWIPDQDTPVVAVECP